MLVSHSWWALVRINAPPAPNGAHVQPLNPNLPDNPTCSAGQAVTTVVSPDGTTLLILTSGYDRVAVTSGANAES
jgi:hypothetical protein